MVGQRDCHSGLAGTWGCTVGTCGAWLGQLDQGLVLTLGPTWGEAWGGGRCWRRGPGWHLPGLLCACVVDCLRSWDTVGCQPSHCSELGREAECHSGNQGHCLELRVLWAGPELRLLGRLSWEACAFLFLWAGGVWQGGPCWPVSNPAPRSAGERGFFQPVPTAWSSRAEGTPGTL